MFFISLFDIISVTYEGLLLLLSLSSYPDANIFLGIPAFAADTAAIIPIGIKMLLANGLITFFINGSHVFSNGPSNVPRNPPDCIILDNWVFDNFISADK